MLCCGRLLAEHMSSTQADVSILLQQTQHLLQEAEAACRTPAGNLAAAIICWYTLCIVCVHSPSRAPVWCCDDPAGHLLPGASLMGANSHVGSSCCCPLSRPFLAFKGPDLHAPNRLIAAACRFHSLLSCDITASVAHSCCRPEVPMLCMLDPTALQPLVKLTSQAMRTGFRHPNTGVFCHCSHPAPDQLPTGGKGWSQD
jgi:hypothetical protein